MIQSPCLFSRVPSINVVPCSNEFPHQCDVATHHLPFFVGIAKSTTPLSGLFGPLPDIITSSGSGKISTTGFLQAPVRQHALPPNRKNTGQRKHQQQSCAGIAGHLRPIRGFICLVYAGNVSMSCSTVRRMRRNGISVELTSGCC